MLRHLPTGAYWRTPTPITSVPEENTRKQPLFIRSRPSPQRPLQALKPVKKTDPNLIYLMCSFIQSTLPHNHKHTLSKPSSPLVKMALQSHFTAG
jgi:hypothetical protein